MRAVCSAVVAVIPEHSRNVIFIGVVLILSAGLPAEDFSREPIRPIPLLHNQDQRKVALGKKLFHDVRLSADNSISCASCHDLSHNGADRRARSLGVEGREGDIRALTVYNARFNLAQFWDGRAHTLEDQVAGPVQNPVEMAADWPTVVARLKRDKSYREAFSAIYADGINAGNIRHAIASFERSLITVNAPFDQWLRGDETAISERQKHGYALFKSYGCVACHQGVNVGGNAFQYFGMLRDYFSDRGNITDADLGRYRVTGDELDRHLFKIPSLRLAIRNSPYFHDGSTPTLEEAIRIMGRYQLGRDIPDPDVEAMADFLASLLGEHPLLSP
jgi:cytochrome c peroxidase